VSSPPLVSMEEKCVLPVNLKGPKKPAVLFPQGGSPFMIHGGPWVGMGGGGGGQRCSPQTPGATVALPMPRNMGAHHSTLLGGTAGCARAAAAVPSEFF
jgi:hypothetical protein